MCSSKASLSLKELKAFATRMGTVLTGEKLESICSDEPHKPSMRPRHTSDLVQHNSCHVCDLVMLLRHLRNELPVPRMQI